MAKPRPPGPKTTIFDGQDANLSGWIPGPIRVDVIDDVIWAAGGRYEYGMAYRYADGRWTHARLPMLPTFIVAISPTEAIVGGAAGEVGRTVDGGATWSSERVGRLFAAASGLVCASRDRAGRVWMGQQDGQIWRAADPRAPFQLAAEVHRCVNTVRQISPTEAMVVTEHAVLRMTLEKRATIMREPIFTTTAASLIGGAIDERGGIVIVANKGRAWFAADGKKFRPIETKSGETAFDAVCWIAPWLVALSHDGALRVSLDGTNWKPVPVERANPVRRLGGVAAYRHGWLVGTMRDDSKHSGSLSYLGDPAMAPLLPAKPPVDPEAIAGLSFVIAERYALLWATTWKQLPDADHHSAAWMELAAKLA